MSAVLTFTDRGIYCPAGDFYIDPWRPVPRALITHGHADHARPGMGAYLCTTIAAPVIRHRLGDITVDTIPYAETRQIGGAQVSFHPAGHVPGSAQIRVEVGGEVWVVSGDYKVVDDGMSDPFEPVACHAFITECTFGLPVFKWTAPDVLKAEINSWWRANAAAGRTSLLGAYSLGKAQRLMALLDPTIGPIVTHGAIENTNAVLRGQGIALPDTIRVTPGHVTPGPFIPGHDRKAHMGAMVLAHRERWAPLLTQRDLSLRRFRDGGHPGNLPNPGVFARHNAVDTPALLPDGGTSDISVPAPVRARGDERPLDRVDIDEVRAISEGETAIVEGDDQ
jgi:putative mRNA 3-end processing factor